MGKESRQGQSIVKSYANLPMNQWTLGKVRELWEWRMRVVNAVGDLLDRCVRIAMVPGG
jgi:hypothetical protein